MMSMMDASPSRFFACSQALLEPILADIARKRGCDLRFDSELAAADGWGSPVQRTLNVADWTLPPTHHYLNLFFRADLTDLARGAACSPVRDCERYCLRDHGAQQQRVDIPLGVRSRMGEHR